jgi:hypothetical protein
VEREAEAWGSYAVTRRSPKLGRHPRQADADSTFVFDNSNTKKNDINIGLPIVVTKQYLTWGKRDFAIQTSRLSCSPVRADEATSPTNGCNYAIECRSGPVSQPQDMESKTMTSADCSEHLFASPNVEKYLNCLSPYNIIFLHL